MVLFDVRRISTIESVEARELSLLAVLEVAFAIGAYMSFAYHIESALPLVALTFALFFFADDAISRHKGAHA